MSVHSPTRGRGTGKESGPRNPVRAPGQSAVGLGERARIAAVPEPEDERTPGARHPKPHGRPPADDEGLPAPEENPGAADELVSRVPARLARVECA
ncbi:hypothetical protein [Streptomyces sp. HNM1019]|uniref:hypothetical protein n=1 Tax=Streptomyces sp. HNM1019 TaxID=3424717 RepID=UPI003D789A9C